MQAAHGLEVYGKEVVLLMAMELSTKSWTLLFGDGSRRRQAKVRASDWTALAEQVEKTKLRWKLPAQVRVVSCYEAGRDGFWLHRALLARGIENQVVDSSSIEVNRRARRAKTDRLDAQQLLQQLGRWLAGERRALSVVRVPEPQAEDQRWLHRSRGHAQAQQTRESNRIRGLLATQGIVIGRMSQAKPERLAQRMTGDGRPLAEGFKAMLAQAWASYEHHHKQVLALEAAQLKQVQEQAEVGAGPQAMMALFMKLKGIGLLSAWPLVMEIFAWRHYRNRRQLGASVGLAPSPYHSGDSAREQGISKAGNRRIRALMIELAWSWLRYQPDSALSKWFHTRFGGNLRSRKVGIVALARKLLIDLWRMTLTGAVPEGALFKAAA